jgi:hypothetical protein
MSGPTVNETSTQTSANAPKLEDLQGIELSLKA